MFAARTISRLALFASAAIVAGATSQASAQGTLQPQEGFVSSVVFDLDPSLPFQEQLGGLTFGPNGERIVYERGEVRSHPRVGPPATLAKFEPAVFGSFLRLAPDGRSVYFGESSNQKIFRIPMTGEGAQVVDEIAFNFDLEFAPETAGEALAGRGFVSAPGSSGNSNSIWLLDDDPTLPNDEVVTGISPFSGPLAFDEEGNLYVVTSGRSDPTTGLPSELILRFSPAQIAGGIGPDTVEASTGFEVLDALDGFYGIEIVDGSIYGTDLGFGSGVGSVTRISLSSGEVSTLTTVHAGDAGFASPSFLAVLQGPDAFEIGNGRFGGEVLIGFSNFDDVSVIAEVFPELHFVRGDVDGNEALDVTDAIGILDWLFFGASDSRVLAPGDVNADDKLDVADPVYLLNFAFRGGPPPPAPFPERGPAKDRGI